MIELRWVLHDFKDGAPPAGSIRVGDRLYQKLQYRTKVTVLNYDQSGMYPSERLEWSEWKDVPHAG